MTPTEILDKVQEALELYSTNHSITCEEGPLEELGKDGWQPFGRVAQETLALLPALREQMEAMRKNKSCPKCGEEGMWPTWRPDGQIMRWSCTKCKYRFYEKEPLA
jgi:ribosomal protein S27AE